ncbi:MAG: prolipoprotein diacylglyceryl transferase [Clostridia bacterium]|nr:prolipoprotein diacylglyceryl transferase [Clostridia bacterium]
MYPNQILLGLTAYDLCLCIAVGACFYIFSVYADKLKIAAKNQTFTVICGIFAVVLGYGSAVLFQAFYNIKTRGEFIIDASTGATFYGGLIGGAAVFLAIYFLAGHFRFKEGSHKAYFFPIANCVAPGIALAHAIGRVGCLFAGCCHGQATKAWYGIMMHGNQGYQKYVPTQLMEAIFLLLLFGFLTVRVLWQKGKVYNLSSYLVFYGIWRFFVENLRADYRGDTVVEWLTPSQLTALLLIAVGIALVFVEKYVTDRVPAPAVPKAEEKKNEKA